MTDKHPITLPDELLQQWAVEYWGNPGETIGSGEQFIAIKAAQWGADQELQACCEWISFHLSAGDARCFRSSRRPKPPSLKEQSLALIKKIQDSKESWDTSDLNIILRALEQLND